MPDEDDGGPGRTSRLGWVRSSCDLRIWIACPGVFPAGLSRDSWAAQTAETRLARSGMAYGGESVSRLAGLLRLVHEDGYATACHQIWIHLPDVRLLPLPVHVGVWQRAGARDARLRTLSGAADPEAVRPPHVTPLREQDGVRALRYRKLDDGVLCGTLGYAFRSDEFETDVQVWTSTPDLRRLWRAAADVDALVSGMTVGPRPAR